MQKGDRVICIDNSRMPNNIGGFSTGRGLVRKEEYEVESNQFVGCGGYPSVFIKGFNCEKRISRFKVVLNEPCPRAVLLTPCIKEYTMEQAIEKMGQEFKIIK